MSLSNSVIYSLRIDKTIKTHLQDYFASIGSDLASGLRKTIYDFYGEIVPPRHSEQDPKLRTSSYDAQNRALLLQSIATALANKLHSVSSSVESISISPIVSATFGEYMRALPPSEVLVTFLTTSDRSETLMIELSRNAQELLPTRQGHRNKKDVLVDLAHLFTFSAVSPNQGTNTQFTVFGVETNVDYCRITSVIEPIIQLSLTVFVSGRIVTATLTLPSRAHPVFDPAVI